MLGPLVKLFEIVGCMMEMRAPIVTEPVHVGLYGVDVFLLLPGRIGVVEAQAAVAAEFVSDAEIETDGLGVANVEVAVRLGREAAHNRFVTV